MIARADSLSLLPCWWTRRSSLASLSHGAACERHGIWHAFALPDTTAAARASLPTEPRTQHARARPPRPPLPVVARRRGPPAPSCSQGEERAACFASHESNAILLPSKPPHRSASRHDNNREIPYVLLSCAASSAKNLGRYRWTTVLKTKRRSYPCSLSLRAEAACATASPLRHRQYSLTLSTVTTSSPSTMTKRHRTEPTVGASFGRRKCGSHPNENATL
jgi:hypothetical protein